METYSWILGVSMSTDVDMTCCGTWYCLAVYTILSLNYHHNELVYMCQWASSGLISSDPAKQETACVLATSLDYSRTEMFLPSVSFLCMYRQGMSCLAIDALCL